MKRVVLASLLMLVSASMVLSAPRSGISMSNDLRMKIGTYVTKQKPTTKPANWRRGRKVEDTADLSDIPADWGKDLAKYKYVYTGDRVWFVDPVSRKAIDVIKVAR